MLEEWKPTETDLGNYLAANSLTVSLNQWELVQDIYRDNSVTVSFS
jgi:hypothetical protein